MKIKTTIVLSLIICTLMFSCATTLHTTVRRPAQLDLGGAKSIAVLPFRTESYNKGNGDVFIFNFSGFWFDFGNKNEDLKLISNDLTKSVSKKIAESEFYDLIAPDVVQAAIENSTEIPCDIYLTGYFSDYKNEIHEDYKTKTEKTDKGEKTVKEYEYKREVHLRLDYDIIDSKTNKILSTSYETISVTSSTYKNKRDVPTTSDLLEYKLKSIASSIIKKIQPYYTTVDLKLLSDKTKDPMMKEANKLAKNGQLEYSKQLFQQLYNENCYMEAGYNAALIMQAQGDLNGAKSLMEKVAADSGNSKAYSALSEINSEIKSAERLRKQLEANASNSAPSAINAK